MRRIEVISCQHCQNYEDDQIIWGTGEPICLDDLADHLRPKFCPQCGAKLSHFDFVSIGLRYSTIEALPLQPEQNDFSEFDNSKPSWTKAKFMVAVTETAVNLPKEK
jgi:hypothetical protein